MTFTEIEFCGGPFDGDRIAMRLPLVPLCERLMRRGSGELVRVTYRLAPGPNGLRYVLERER